MSKIKLRRAEIRDIPLLEKWDDAPHVKVSRGLDEAADWQTEIVRYAEWQWIFIAELGHHPIGVVIVMDPEKDVTHYWGAVPKHLRAIDIWIGEKHYLGKGFGTQMMQEAIAFCFKEPAVTGILIDPLKSNHRARKFYEQLGFKAIEERLFNRDLCIVYSLKREDWP